MELEFECIPCIYRQVLEASRMVTDNEDDIKKIMYKYAEMVPEISSGISAPEVVSQIQRYVKDITGEEDPYYSFKEENMKLALEYYPEVEKIIENDDDPLHGALIMSAMGNAIDAGVSLEVDLEGSIKSAVKSGFRYSDYLKFKEKLKKADKLVIVADNSGEAVFDRLLINELKEYDIDITYAVREKPVLNDVTLKEAKEIGLDKISNVISSGCDTPGIVLDNSSQEFKEIFDEADIIISKGQGNLEGMLGNAAGIFYLLKIKCELIADRLDFNLKVGDFIFKYI